MGSPGHLTTVRVEAKEKKEFPVVMLAMKNPRPAGEAKGLSKGKEKGDQALKAMVNPGRRKGLRAEAKGSP